MNLLLMERLHLSCSERGPRKQETNYSPMIGKKIKKKIKN